DGQVVHQKYWSGTDADTPREAFSVTKSITSTLVGIAQDDGSLHLSDSASKYIPQWRTNAAKAVTIANLLSMDSGRHFDAATDYRTMAVAAPDKTKFSIGLPQDEAPGKVWVYNNSAVQTLSAVIKAATGQSATDFSKAKLLDPIGMRHSVMTKDRS